jgi:hypothetical protein
MTREEKRFAFAHKAVWRGLVVSAGHDVFLRYNARLIVIGSALNPV